MSEVDHVEALPEEVKALTGEAACTNTIYLNNNTSQEEVFSPLEEAK
jgi:hypothetical protein